MIELQKQQIVTVKVKRTQHKNCVRYHITLDNILLKSVWAMQLNPHLSNAFIRNRIKLNRDRTYIAGLEVKRASATRDNLCFNHIADMAYPSLRKVLRWVKLELKWSVSERYEEKFNTVAEMNNLLWMK